MTYWNKFAETGDPKDAAGVHAYSHVNTFSSAAMAYALAATRLSPTSSATPMISCKTRNAMPRADTGRSERIMPPGGKLGKALNYHQNSCETPCCSWASFKLARYLTEFTGEARYGDWVEWLMYNGVARHPAHPGHGRHFYYADYRVAGGVKVFSRDAYTCCSGTYCQGGADYPNQIYYKDPSSLYVSLYVPSEVTWKRRAAAKQ